MSSILDLLARVREWAHHSFGQCLNYKRYPGPHQKRMAQDNQASVDLSERTGNYPTMVASVASIGLSLYLFYARKNKLQGIFVGLWAPTFLALSSYLKLAKIHNTVEKLTGNRLMNRIEKVMEAQ